MRLFIILFILGHTEIISVIHPTPKHMCIRVLGGARAVPELQHWRWFVSCVYIYAFCECLFLFLCSYLCQTDCCCCLGGVYPSFEFLLLVTRSCSNRRHNLTITWYYSYYMNLLYLREYMAVALCLWSHRSSQKHVVGLRLSRFPNMADYALHFQVRWWSLICTIICVCDIVCMCVCMHVCRYVCRYVGMCMCMWKCVFM